MSFPEDNSDSYLTSFFDLSVNKSSDIESTSESRTHRKRQFNMNDVYECELMDDNQITANKQALKRNLQSSMARNDYFRDNYYYIMSIAKAAVNIVRKSYASLNKKDLLEYALEGVIVALSKFDNFNEEVKSNFIYIHACRACLHGALQMVGIQRRRKNYEELSDGQKLIVFKSIQPYRPETITEFIDSLQLDAGAKSDMEERMVNQLDAKIFYHQLQSRLLKRIFCLIIQGRTSHDICKRLNISKRSYYYCVQKLYQSGKLFQNEQVRENLLMSSDKKIDLQEVFCTKNRNLKQVTDLSESCYKKAKRDSVHRIPSSDFSVFTFRSRRKFKKQWRH